MARQGLQRHDIPVPGLLDRTPVDDAVDKAINTLDKLAGKIPLKGGPKAVIARLGGRAVVKLTRISRDVLKVEQLREAVDAYQVLYDALGREIEKLEQENSDVKNMFDAAIADGRQQRTYTEAQRLNLLAALEPRQIRIREARRVRRALTEEIRAIEQRMVKALSQ